MFKDRLSQRAAINHILCVYIRTKKLTSKSNRQAASTGRVGCHSKSLCIYATCYHDLQFGYVYLPPALHAKPAGPILGRRLLTLGSQSYCIVGFAKNGIQNIDRATQPKIGLREFTIACMAFRGRLGISLRRCILLQCFPSLEKKKKKVYMLEGFGLATHQ